MPMHGSAYLSLAVGVEGQAFQVSYTVFHK